MVGCIPCWERPSGFSILRASRPTGPVRTLHCKHTPKRTCPHTWPSFQPRRQQHSTQHWMTANICQEPFGTLVPLLAILDILDLTLTTTLSANTPISLSLPIREVRHKEAVTGNKGQNHPARPLCNTASQPPVRKGLNLPGMLFPPNPFPPEYPFSFETHLNPSFPCPRRLLAFRG